MKKKFLYLLAAYLILCIAMALTSCDAEFSNDVNGSPEEYHAKIANTHWQLAEVMNQNNEWVSPEFYAGFDIPDLSFGYSNSYFMKICTHEDRADFTNINGTYSIDKYFSITMTDDNYQGIAYTFKVTNLKDNILEGDFLDWRHEQRHYTVRMKRIEK